MGLVAQYKFNGSSYDSSGNANSGIAYNTVLTEDRFGNTNSAYYFNGYSSYISIPGEYFDFKNEFSLSFWLKQSAGQVDFSGIFDKSHYVGKGWILQKSIVSDTTYYLAYRQFEDGIDRGWSNVYGEYYHVVSASEKWQHIVITKKDTNISYYLNSKLQMTEITDYANIYENGDLPLYIGAVQRTNRYFKGIIDDINIYDHSLTDSEIFSLGLEGSCGADFKFENAIQETCTIQNIQPNTYQDIRYLTLNKYSSIYDYTIISSKIDESYWYFEKSTSGYFYIKNICTNNYLINDIENNLVFSDIDNGDNRLWHLYKNLDGLFFIKNKYSSLYLVSDDDGVSLKNLGSINKGIWNIKGNCEFIANELYLKHYTEFMSQCPIAISINTVQLIGVPIYNDQDNVNLSVYCGSQKISTQSKVFEVGNNYYFYDDFLVGCADYPIDIVFNVGEKSYTLEIPKNEYRSYIDDSFIRYDISKYQLNEGAVIFNADGSTSIDAGISGKASAKMLGGLLKAKASFSTNAWLEAYTSFSAWMPKICVEYTSSTGGNIASDIFAKILLFNENSSFLSGKPLANVQSYIDGYSQGEICTKIDEESKYKVDLSFHYDSSPYCYTNDDILLAKHLTIKIDKIDRFNYNNDDIVSYIDILSIESSYYSRKFDSFTKNKHFECQNFELPCEEEFILNLNGHSMVFPCNETYQVELGGYDINLSYNSDIKIYDVLSEDIYCKGSAEFLIASLIMIPVIAFDLI